MNIRIVLLLTLALPCAASAQDFLGAAKAVERYTAETARTEKAAAKKPDLAEWQTRLREFPKAASALSPQEAAARWLALCDEWRTLPADADGGPSFSQRSNGRDFTALLQVLPAPAAWDALDALIAARPATEEMAVFDRALRLLSTALRGDRAALAAGLTELRKALTKRPGGAELARYTLSEIETWIASLQDDPQEIVTRFEAQIAAAESGEGESTLEAPDLVTLAGATRAGVLLRRALAAPGVELEVDTGDATRTLAVKLATQWSADLKKGQWGLIRGLSAEDVALYEALEKRFPRKDDEDLSYGDRVDAERYYLLGLIAAKRTAEAAALALQIGGRADGSASFLGHGDMDGLLKAGFASEVQAFLRGVLTSHPALPFWEEFIRISAQGGQAPEALAFLRETAARGDLSAAAGERVRTHLVSALLAADDVESGVKLLREELAAKVARIEAAPATPTQRGRFSISSFDSPARQAGQTALRLSKLGQLLEKPEWIEEGLRAARQSLAVSQRDPQGRPNVAGEVADLLLDLGRGAEAERILIDEWIAIGQRPPAEHLGEPGEPKNLVALAVLYHRTKRPEDVLALLTNAPGWGVSDLGGVLAQSAQEIPIGHAAASALAAVGRKDEARRVALRLLGEKGGYDPTYEMLHRLGGADLPAQLDRLSARDRFEERPLIWKAQLLLESGQLAEAEQTARAAIAIDPSDGEQGQGTRMRVYAVLGDILEKKGDAAQAKIMRGAVAAIRLSEEADDWWSAGLLSRAVRKYEEALGHFADAYCIQSRLALRYTELGDFPKAETHYQRAYELMPESFGRVESHCFGCEGAFRGERAQGIAERVFTRLAERMPEKPQIFYLLGYLREAQQRYLEAAEQLRRAVKLDPDYLNAWSQLAGLGTHIALPRAERETAALALVRLDPLGKHRGHRSFTSGGRYGGGDYGEIADFRTLWAVLAASAVLAPEDAAELLALPASKTRLEEKRKAAEEAKGTAGRHASILDLRPAAQTPKRTAAEAVAEHAFLQSLAQLMQLVIEL